MKNEKKKKKRNGAELIWATAQLYCDIGAGLRQSVLLYTRSIVAEEAKAGEVVSQYTWCIVTGAS